jgi:hypothetical protein
MDCSVVNVAAVSHVDGKDEDLATVDVQDDSVVTYAVPPQAGQWTAQRLARLGGILKGSESDQGVPDASSRALVEFA